jgi:integrase/recombinase XerD
MAIEATSTPRAVTVASIAVDGWLGRYGNPRTRRSYSVTIGQWLTWCDDHGIDTLAAHRLHIEAWIRHLEDAGRQRSTIAHKLHVLASFYGYCEIDELVARNPMRHVRRPRVPFESTSRGLTRTQFADLLTAAEDERPSVLALVCLLGLNGMRVSEACGIQIPDIGVTGYHRTITITRKGGKRQSLPMAPLTAHAVDLARGDRPVGPLLLTRAGDAAMSRSGARKVIARLGRRIGLPFVAHPHGLRHTFATLARDAGVPDRDIVASAGWASPQMLEYYDRARERLDRNATWALTSFVRGAA